MKVVCRNTNWCTLKKMPINATNVLMQPPKPVIWSCICWFTFLNKKNASNAVYVILQQFTQIHGKNTKYDTKVKSLWSVTNATLLHFFKTVWNLIWKDIMGKSLLGAELVIMPQHMETSLGHIWKESTLTKRIMNVTSVEIVLLKHVNWRLIWKFTSKKNHSNAYSVTIPLPGVQTFYHT